jgi:type VI secretion system FHA domain protein
MTLRLRIVSDQRRSLGDRSSIELSTAGCTIGRSLENDWVLPDPQRYISARHARIIFRESQYVLEDMSTNGCYLNDDQSPIGKQGKPLHNGDLVRMGEYQIIVTISAVVDPGVPTQINTLGAVQAAAQADLGAQLNLNELFVFEESVARETVAPPVAGPPSLLSDEPSDSKIARRIARLARAANRGESNRSEGKRNGANLPALYDVQSGMVAFCRGAGIEAEKLPADAQTRLMHLVGQLVREVLVGLKDLDRARHQTHNRFRIDLPTDPEDNRPSVTQLTVEELILRLLTEHEKRGIDAVQWLREAVAAGKEHEAAVLQAMRQGFIEFLDRLDPAELEARFERAARRGKFKAADRAQYWQQYTEFYRNLIEMPADHLPHTFVEAFATAYRKNIKKETAK